MSRGVSPVVGVVLLIALTVTLSATLLSAVSVGLSEPAPSVSLHLSVDESTDRIELSHRGGDEIDVTEMEITVAVDGEELRHQPPVPFFAARGFESGPVGAFNSATSNTFRAGETTSFALASTNTPEIRNGATVSVQIVINNSVVFEENVAVP